MNSNISIKFPTTEQEWDAVKRFRQVYFFDNVPIEDPYQWTFHDPEHRHWIIYQSELIVGYAHVVLWPNHRAAMRIIVIEDKFRDHGLGGELLKHIEDWLAANHYTCLHVESRKDSLRFYQKHGYTEKPFDDPEGHETHPDDIALAKSLLHINSDLARNLIDSQFPQWKDLPIRAVAQSGWDNRTFHLGDALSIRMPSAAQYEGQIEKEHQWLPELAPFLPLEIPQPIAIGAPGDGYPWKWGIYKWLDGEAASSGHIDDLNAFAKSLAEFLLKLHQIDTTDGPPPGPHNFYRGGDLRTYDQDTRDAIKALEGKIDGDAALKLWESALKTSWEKPPVWIHGDIALGNLLVKEGALSAVIDFGQLGVGDPACDLAITWTLFDEIPRGIFRSGLNLDDNTWLRGKAWTLWKALVTAAGFTNPNNAESSQCMKIIETVLKS